MRVLLINFWDQGGMLHYTAQLANSLAQLDELDVKVVLPRSAFRSAQLLFRPVVSLQFADVPTNSSWSQLLRIPRQLLLLPRLALEITKWKPDIIQATSAHVWLILLLPWLSRHFPVVSILHDIWPHPGLDDTKRKRLEINSLIRCSDALFVHSGKLKEMLCQNHPELESENIHVISHGDYAFFKRWEKGIREEPDSILFFGRIREYKGLPVLLEAYLKVREKVKDARLIVAGEGPLGALKQTLINLPGCELYNEYIPDEEVSSYFERAAVVVCPYIEASQSGIIPIASAYMKPVIATAIGGLPDSVIDGETGLLIPPGDPGALAQAIVRLLQDHGMRRQMGENAYRRMKMELAWEPIAGSMVEVYKTAAQRRMIAAPIGELPHKKAGFRRITD